MKVALFGCGVVGSRVADLLLCDNSNFELKKVLVKDLSKSRLRASSGKSFSRLLFTKDPSEIIEDPEIELIIEVLGNEQPALDYLLQSLERKKHVISANKELISKHGGKLFAKAREKGVCLKIDASVGGGIPVISNLLENLKTSEISEIWGVLNGTTNYILSEMAKKSSFNQALADAQAKGYAEPDPRNDLEGLDTKYKISILASIAFKKNIDPDQVDCQGISKISQADFSFAEEEGFALRLLGFAKKQPENKSINIFVHPYLILNGLSLAKIEGVLNAVHFKGDLIQELTLIGPGAGADPTSNAILSDALSILEKRYSLESLAEIYQENSSSQEINILLGEGKFYLRLTVEDRAGVLKEITKSFSDRQISIKSISQKVLKNQKNKPGQASLFLLTHQTNEQIFKETVEQLEKLTTVKSVDCILKVLEF